MRLNGRADHLFTARVCGKASSERLVKSNDVLFTFNSFNHLWIIILVLWNVLDIDYEKK